MFFVEFIPVVFLQLFPELPNTVFIYLCKNEITLSAANPDPQARACVEKESYLQCQPRKVLPMVLGMPAGTDGC